MCEESSKHHEKLGHSISYIKNINDDFKESLRFYKKILIKIFQYNRNTRIKIYYFEKNLRDKIEGKKESKKYYKEANELIEDDEENFFPEFNEKYILKNQIVKKVLN